MFFEIPAEYLGFKGKIYMTLWPTALHYVDWEGPTGMIIRISCILLNGLIYGFVGWLVWLGAYVHRILFVIPVALILLNMSELWW